MSTTRRTASSNCARTRRKCRVLPRSAAAKTIPQRSRTAAAVNSFETSSVVEGTSPDGAQLFCIGYPRRREIAGGFLCLDLDRSVKRHQPIRERELLHHLDPLRPRRLVLDVRHRHPAVDPADPEPMEDVRHQLL